MLKSNFFIAFSIWDMLSRKAMTLLNMDLEKKKFPLLIGSVNLGYILFVFERDSYLRSFQRVH